eukprot:365596-Chlamydomonas_euryale.AAC.5
MEPCAPHPFPVGAGISTEAWFRALPAERTGYAHAWADGNATHTCEKMHGLATKALERVRADSDAMPCSRH